MNSDGRWTYADMNGRGWCEPNFETKEEAIEEAKKVYPFSEYVLIGQIEFFHGEEYIENQERVS